MLRFILPLFALSFFFHTVFSQRLISSEESVKLAINNQRNLKAANLSLQQQQQLVKGVADISNPQLEAEISPYEPLVIGVQQSFNFPSVYRNRKALQNERIQLAQLQLNGSQYELKRQVRTVYLQLQYYAAKIKLITYQDSIYQAIKISSKRFFDAGQINKLEEIQASSEADKIRNELMRVAADLNVEKQIFSFYTNFPDTFSLDPLEVYSFIPFNDTVFNNIQQQILQQQIAVTSQELRVQKAGLLPQFNAGLSFPTTKNYERAIGYKLGVSIPIWMGQNRSRIAAAQTGIEIAKAERDLQQLRFNAQYRQVLMNYQKELNSLTYFNNTALPQASAIVETSQRLFHGGVLNYIESLRNLRMAFDIFNDHLETHRTYNETVILLYYLTGKL